ncbi:RNA exonuclease 1-like protein [Dinothrombium tinctorium]|uniref:RNA exonuclease 1-like protein n=1 Tax=Dinothrombium tinctorium TaxID=1965070 RepID=A0A3S3PVE8_9ACAR|nr:RNA exonuclease 1-like protein [Dinothrombium tinctorium]
MLQSSGYFNTYICPFFKNGLCERPYCHFKHAKSTSNPIPTYVPTPLYKTVSSADTVAKRKATAAKPVVPEYKPTPISELQKLKASKQQQQQQDQVLSKSNDKSKVAEEDEIAVSKDETKEETKTKTASSNKQETEFKLGNDSTREEQNEDQSLTLKSIDKTSVQSDESDIECIEDSTDINVSDDEKNPTPEVPSTSKSDTIKHSNSELVAESCTIPTKKARIAHKQADGSTYGKKRIAHNLKPILAPPSKVPHTTSVVPTKKENPIEEIKRPTLPTEFGGKVPISIRQRYLNLIIDECVKCCADIKKAYDRALEEEKVVYNRSNNKAIYVNLAANLIKRLRDEAGIKNDGMVDKKQPKIESSTKIGNRLVSHETILNGPQASNCSIEKRDKPLRLEDLSDSMLYNLLKKFVLSKDQLREYGYPVQNPDVKDEVIYPLPDNKVKNNFMSSRRICSRCRTAFQVNEKGVPIKRETCVFHNGRLWNERFNKSVERKYSCCKGDSNSGGCCTAKSHVSDGYGHPDLFKGYCYTTIGLELTRVSVIDHNCKTVYESLVKPKHTILDYNTKFSGIQEGDLDSVTTTLEDVQKKLLNLINSETILIGHSLDSDFKALKLVHETVIDTCAVFPHKLGLPYRRALKTLTAEYLKKIIQDEVSGHDSLEDALSCMQLIRLKVGQELSKLKKST